MGNVWHLDLGGTRITDAGLAEIEKMPQVMELFLRGTAVTDAGMVHVERMPRLEWLDIDDTGVSEEKSTEIRNLLLRSQATR